MNKTRSLLSFVLVLTITGQILILNSNLPNDWRFTLHVADGILLLSALTMLLFSFFRVGVTACGELCYNPDNWYWRTMTWFCNVFMKFSNPFDRGKGVSLCKAFWLTVGAILAVTGLLVFIGLLVSVIWDAYWKYGLLKMILGALGLVAIIAIAFGTIVGLSIGGKKVVNKIDEAVGDKPRLRNATKTTGNILGVLVFIGIVFLSMVVVPIILIIEKAKVSLYIAIIYYLVGVTGLALTIGGAWLLIWGIFWYLPKIMHGTVLEQFLSAKKKQFCPTLTACSIR